MISHQIEIHKEKLQHQITQYQSTGALVRWPNFHSQADLDKWLNATKFKEGDYVTYMRLPLEERSVAHTVFIIEQVQRDYDLLTTRSWAPYHFILFALRSLPDQVTGEQGPLDWKDANMLRHVTPEEMQKYVEPFLDRVHNNCKPR